MRKLYFEPTVIGKMLRLNHGSETLLPVSDDDYLAFVNRLFRLFEKLILEQQDDVFDIVLTDYTFVIFLAQHLHMNAVRNVCVRNNVDVEYGRHFENLVRPDWEHLGAWYEQGIAETNLLLEWLRSRYYTSRYEDMSIFNRFKSIIGTREVCSIGRRGWQKDELIRKEGIKCFQQLEPQLWLSSLNVPYTSSVNYFDCIVQPILSYLAETDPLYLESADQKSIAKTWIRRLKSVEAIYYQLRRMKAKPATMFVTGGTNPFRKAMVLAFQRENVDVRVLHHGNDVGARIQEHVHRAEVSHCQKFVCPTRQIAINYETCYQDVATEMKSGTKYPDLNTNHYRKYFEDCRTNSKMERLVTVMLIGRPLNNLRLLDSRGGFFLHKIDLEHQLIKYFQSTNYRLLYKMHPEWSVAARSVYGELECELVGGDFEHVWQSADMFVFTTATTTAFELSLCTDRPVVLFDAKGNPWQEHVRNLVEKRCEIVDYSIDERGSAILDNDEVEVAIDQAAEKRLDYSFIKEVMW